MAVQTRQKVCGGFTACSEMNDYLRQEWGDSTMESRRGFCEGLQPHKKKFFEALRSAGGTRDALKSMHVHLLDCHFEDFTIALGSLYKYAGFGIEHKGLHLKNNRHIVQ